jgi:hypothetical protein
MLYEFQDKNVMELNIKRLQSVYTKRRKKIYAIRSVTLTVVEAYPHFLGKVSFPFSVHSEYGSITFL